MRIYPGGWLPPREPQSGMNQKYVDVADRHDIALEAIRRLESYIAMPEKPRGPDLVPAMQAWIDILGTPDDPRYGVLIWFILHSRRCSGEDKWVWALNFANGRFTT